MALEIETTEGKRLWRLKQLKEMALESETAERKWLWRLKQLKEILAKVYHVMLHYQSADAKYQILL